MEEYKNLANRLKYVVKVGAILFDNKIIEEKLYFIFVSGSLKSLKIHKFTKLDSTLL